MRAICLFLRGINVGGANRVQMAALTLRLAEAGHPGAVAVVQSGNLIAGERPGVAEATVAACAALGARDVWVKAVTPHRLAALLAAVPVARVEGDGAKIHYWFRADAGPVDPAKLNALRAGAEMWWQDADAIGLFAPDGIGRSKLAAGMERALGERATARNLNTVARMIAKAAAWTP